MILLRSRVVTKSRTEDRWPGWWRVGSLTCWIKKESCIASRNLADRDVGLLEHTCLPNNSLISAWITIKFASAIVL